tara:strand:- start:59337 stop:68258 length:8922 start_codon:yes stop_codon:yes gene_type:complete
LIGAAFCNKVTGRNVAFYQAVSKVTERELPGLNGMALDNDVAIVGIACRLPQANNPDEAWALMTEGRHAITKAPKERWATKMRVAQQKGPRTQPIPEYGGYLDDIAGFDARFFGTTAREARLMDPQQRLLLEGAWEAIEAAGIDPAAMKGSRTGVFVGISTSDYLQRQILDSDLITVDAYSGLGIAQSIAANRISYFFDFKGPSAASDTACSSGLVALHLARRSLANGECDYAIVGAVNVIVSPLSTISFSKARMLSPDGRCKTFDKSADGYVRSEGCATLLLTREDLALRKGHRIEALVRGSAINQDGRTLSITTPSEAAQAQVLRDALADARLAPGDLDLIEAHGTGTAVGDGIEIGALREVFGKTPREHPLILGAAKPHFGHLEAASGLVGAIKAVRELQTGLVPSLPFLADPIDPDAEGRIVIADHEMRLRDTPRALRAGLSSFGFGGTNAHIILEAPTEPVHSRAGKRPPPPAQRVLPVAGHTASTLRATAADYAAMIEADPEFDLDALCRSADEVRARHPFRRAIVFGDRNEAVQRLRAVAGETPRAGDASAPKPGKLALCFSGQGAQSPGMCRRLMKQDPVFGDVMARLDMMARDEGFPGLIDTILDESAGAGARLSDTATAQPALFAVGLALARSWMARGVVPDYVLGHSLGEITAACLAGVMDERAAMRLVILRGRLMADAPGDGEMAVLSGTADAVDAFVAELPAGLEISGRNTARSITVSGTRDAVALGIRRAEAAGLKVTPLSVSHAFHSSLMDPVLNRFADALKGVAFSPPRIPVISNVAGTLVGPDTPMDAAYWVRHLRSAVEFGAAVETLLECGVGTIAEVGPRPMLLPWLRQLTGDRETVGLVRAIAGGQDDMAGLLGGLGELWSRGHTVDWSKDRRADAGQVRLPPFRFAREPFWFKTAAPEPDERPRETVSSGAALVTRQIDEGGLADVLDQHRVGGRAVVPGALYLDMMTDAALKLIGPGRSFQLVDCRLPQALALSEVRGHALSVRAETRGEEGWSLVAVAPGRDGADEKLLAHALVRPCDATPSARLFAHLPPGKAAVAGPDLYTALEDHGLTYGPAFQGIRSVESGNGQAEARFEATGGAAPGAAMLDPARFDAVFHPIALALRTVDAEAAAGLWIPTGFESLTVHASMPGEAVVQAALVDGPHMPDLKSFDLSVRTPEDVEAISVKGLRIRRIDGRAGAALPTGPLFATSWAPLETSHDTSGVWVVEEFGGSGDLAESLRVETGSPRGPLVLAIDCSEVAQGQDAITALAMRLRHLATREADRPERVLAVYLEDPDRTNPAAEAMRAAIRVFRNEVPALSAANLTLPRDLPEERRREVLAQALANGTESDLCWRNGTLAGLRLEPTVPGGQTWSPPAHGREVRVLVPGARAGPRGLSFDPRPAIEPGPTDVQITPRAAGLNFRDVLKTKRLYPNRPGLPLWLGDECAGIVRAVGKDVRGVAPGDAVVAVAPRAFASEVVAPATAVVRKPQALSFDEAATLPIAFSTAWYALMDLARIEPGQSVLVHAGAGGVGLAALQIARSRGARLFATAGSEEKRAYLARLGVEAVGSSRDTSFVDTIREATGGEGIDVVLSSLPGREMIEASLDLLRPFGCYVDIGKRDIVENTEIGMRVLHKSLSLHTVDMELLFASAPEKAGRILRDVMAAVETGDLAPLPFERFEMSDPGAAFQKMAGAGNIGKIVLGLPEDMDTAPVTRTDISVGAALVTGAFGGIGLDLVDALAAAGVRAFVLVGRSAPAGATLARVVAWRASGLDVMTAQVDVSQWGPVAAVFDEAKAAGFDIRHVFHAAGVLADRLISDVEPKDIAAAWGVKVDGALNLDAASQGREIDTFVCLSSISTLLGSPGQMAYAAANAGMEAICARRRAAGLAGQAIVLGPWQAGLGVSNAGTTDRLERLGLRSFSRVDGINVLKKALTANATAPVAARFTLGWQGTPVPPVAQLSICADLFPKGAGRAGLSAHGRAGILADLAKAAVPERPGLLAAYLRDRLANVTGQGADTMPLDAPLQALGFDSLSGLEFGMLVEEEIGAGVPLDRIDDATSISDLAALLLSRLDLDAQTLIEAPAPPPAQEDPKPALPAPGAIPPQAEATAEDYIKNVRPDFTRNLPVLKLDADYDRAAGMTLSGMLDGTRRDVLDFVGGYGSGLFGHNHPDIVAAVTQTLTTGRPMQVQGAARPLAGRLAEDLAAALRDETGLDYVTTFANTGAEAVEAALKHALMDYADRMERAGVDLSILSDEAASDYAPAIMTVEGSYHGKTLSALSIGHFRGWPKGRAGFRVISVPRDDPDAITRAIAAETIRVGDRDISRIAGAFAEPVQGEGGIHPLPEDVLRALRDGADAGGFPLVFDEIQCGFYRCGALSAASRKGVVADYYTFGKSLGGGVAKISAFLVRRDRYRDGFGALQSSTFAEDDFSSRAALAALAVARRDRVGDLAIERGNALTARLGQLASTYPDIVREVRGEGLMVGLELADLSGSPTGLIADAVTHEFLGQIVTSHLLLRSGVRVATTLSAPNTFRLQPSAYVTEAEIARLVSALERVFVALRMGDGAFLVSHLLERADWLDAPRDYPDVAPDRKYGTGEGAADTRVAFAVHITDSDAIARWDASWERLPPDAREALVARFAPVVEPMPLRVEQVTSANGAKVDIHFWSVFATAKTIEAAMRQGDTDWLTRKVAAIAQQASEAGCNVLGLGGFLSIATRNGLRVQTPRIGITTGNALTIAAGLAGVEAQIVRVLGGAKPRIAVVGAAGNIGRTWARALAQRFGGLTLVGRPGTQGRLKALADDIRMDSREHGAEAPDLTLADTLDALSDCNVIVAATNASAPIVFAHHLGPDPTLLFDLSVPGAVDPAIAEGRNDVALLSGGVTGLPEGNETDLAYFGLPKRHVFACMAETAILGLDGRSADFSIGDVDLSQVNEISALATSHGFDITNVSEVSNASAHGEGDVPRVQAAT